MLTVSKVFGRRVVDLEQRIERVRVAEAFVGGHVEGGAAPVAAEQDAAKAHLVSGPAAEVGGGCGVEVRFSQLL